MDCTEDLGFVHRRTLYLGPTLIIVNLMSGLWGWTEVKVGMNLYVVWLLLIKTCGKSFSIQLYK